MTGVPKKIPEVGKFKRQLNASVRGVQVYRHRESYTMTDILKAPFPWPGGKSDMSPQVWARFGTVENYVEPFCGSAAMLLARPGGAHATETVNDVDGLLINAYRSIQFAPDETAEACDWPVSEADLTSRHLYLKSARDELTARLFADPFYCDPLMGAWWLWGIASWIGDGWCVADGPWINVDGRLVDRRVVGSDEDGVTRKMPEVGAGNVAGGGYAFDRGIQLHRRASVPRKMPEIGRSPNGQMNFNRKGVQAYRHHEGVDKRIPMVARRGYGQTEKGVNIYEPTALSAYFARLSDRLRRVRFLCGDWRRAVKDSVTVNHGLTAVFLDPPYPQAEHDMGYHSEDGEIILTGDVDEDNKRIAAIQEPWYQAAAWAVERGDDPRLRICIAGYYSEQTDQLFPASWERLRWETRGGYANQKKDGRGRANAKRECLWLSPHCLNPADEARDTLSRPIVARASDYTGTMFEEPA